MPKISDYTIVIGAQDATGGVVTALEQKLKGLGATGKDAMAGIEKGALSSASAFGSLAGKLGIFGGASGIFLGLASMIKSTANAGENFLKLSHQTGLAVEQISALDYVAKITDTSIESLTRGVGIFSKGIAGVKQVAGEFNIEGSKTLQALDMIGISVKNAGGNLKDTHSILLEVATRFSTMKDGAEKTALAMQLFGRSGKELIPLLNQGAEGIIKLEAEAARLGITFTEKSAKAADEFNDNLKRMQGHLKSLTYNIGNVVIPIVTDLFDSFSNEGRAKLGLKSLEEDVNRLKGQIQSLESISFFGEGLSPQNTERLEKLKQQLVEITPLYKTLSEQMTKKPMWEDIVPEDKAGKKPGKPEDPFKYLWEGAGKAVAEIKKIPDAIAEVKRASGMGALAPSGLPAPASELWGQLAKEQEQPRLALKALLPKPDLGALKKEYDDLKALSTSLAPTDIAGGEVLGIRVAELKTNLQGLDEPRRQLEGIKTEIDGLGKAIDAMKEPVKISVESTQAVEDTKKVQDGLDRLEDKTIKVGIEFAFKGPEATKEIERLIAESIARRTSPIPEALKKAG